MIHGIRAKNIGKFQRFFGTKNFVIVDNNEVGDDVFDMVGKQVRRLLRKVDNHIKSMIESELSEVDSYGNVDSYIIPNFRICLVMHNRRLVVFTY